MTVCMSMFLFFVSCSQKSVPEEPQDKTLAGSTAEEMLASAKKQQAELRQEALTNDTIIVNAIKVFVTQVETTTDEAEGKKYTTSGFSLFLTSSDKEEGEKINYSNQESESTKEYRKLLFGVKPENFELTYVNKRLTRVRVKTVWETSSKAIPGFIVWQADGGWMM